MRGKLLRSVLATALVAVLGGAPALAQTPQVSDYSKPPSQFPNFFRPYRSIYVPEPVLTNSPRVEQLIKEGKLQLTLRDAIDLTLENNLDITVQRYTPWLAETDILRQRAGNAFVRFDPQVTSTFAWDRRSTPVNNPYLAGTGIVALTALVRQATQANFQYTQGFMTGTTMTITQNNSRDSSTSPAQIFNPALNSSLSFAFSQALLNGFGFLPNTRLIKIAKNSKRVADLTFQDQVITTVSQVQNLYWELVFAREDVKVKQRSVELAEKLYTDNKRQVEIGTLAPIEVVRAEAEVARARQELIAAQTLQLQQQTQLKNAIAKNPLDPVLRDAEIIPTDVISRPPQVEILPLQDAVKEAWEKRPDVRQSQIDLESRDLSVRATRNALLPSLTLSGTFSGSGLAGNTRRTVTTPTGAYTSDLTSPVVDANGTPILIGGQPVYAGTQVRTSSVVTSESGLLDALRTVKNFDYPTYSVQVSLSFPIRNRAAQADNARALLEHRQAETRLRQLQNGVVVEVRNAQIALEQNRARVEAAVKSRELAERTLDAEQKKYQLGASTIFFVIQAQRDLAAAQSVEVRTLVDLVQSKVEFERALGRTLEVNNIDIKDAQAGQVTRTTLIPGTIAAEIIGGSAKF